MLLHLRLPPPIPPPSHPNHVPRPQTLTTTDSGLLFRRKLHYLSHTLGLDPTSTLAVNPSLRSLPLSSLLSLSSTLRLFHVTSPSDAARILSAHPLLLTAPPDAHLLPVLRFLLHDVSLLHSSLRPAVLRCPRILVSSVPDQLRPTLYFLRRIGFVGRHRITAQTTLLLVSSVERTLIPKLDYLQSLGFSYKEVVKMVLRSPGLFTLSVERNFRPKVEFLVGEMGRDLSEVKNFPQYFSFSLDRRIRPRHRMLVENGFEMSLKEMLRVSDGEFSDRLVEMRLRSLDGVRSSLNLSGSS